MFRILLALLLALLAAPASGGGDNPFLAKHLAAARAALDEERLTDARASVERALERDDRHLGALLLWAEVCERAGDLDAAVYALHQWQAIGAVGKKPAAARAEIKAVAEKLALLDVTAAEFRRLTDDYVKELRRLEKDHSARGRLHSAIAVLEEILHILPGDAETVLRLVEIQRTGGADVATEDLFAGADPLEGADPEWIAAEDPKHLEWDAAWVEETPNYRIRTNAGYLVMKTAGIAMEQMNQAYRQFFRYKLDGDPTPRINVHIFKTRDEYLTLGQGPPVSWSGGHFTGDAVETYVNSNGRDPVRGEDSIREMFGTLFHEAAHQFVSLTGDGVPGLLIEAYDSFFEGTVILSNGTVRWNQVNPGRLFALAPRLEKGWMLDPGEGEKDADGVVTGVERAPSFRMLVEGQYDWGPVWYAPTWGVVYFLYNWRDPKTGRAVLRDPLHAYYQSRAGDLPWERRAEHFAEIVLAGDDAPARTVDELNPIWKDWILALRDAQLGKGEGVTGPLDYGDAALKRGDEELAAELYEEARITTPDDPEVLWRQAEVMNGLKEYDRAAAAYRAFAREMSLRGRQDDPRFARAVELMEKLDPLHRKHTALKQRLGEQGMALARSYRERAMPRMAMEIARRMSASWSMPDAMEFYAEVARASGVSLARWKIAYNEYDLEGWSSNKAYRAYGKVIEADVVHDETISTDRSQLQTQELAYDAAFEGDFSLEADMRFGKDGSVMGLCFGRKDADNTHAVVLHRKGYLDVSTKSGATWTVRDHLQVPLRAEDWTRVRIDVVTAGDGHAEVDVYLDGKWLRTSRMPRDSVRGSFGLITATGRADYQEVRLLARDPHDPAARVERELALQRRKDDASLRVPGVFLGLEPPALHEGEWLQGEPVDLLAARGRPVLLCFWTTYQDEAIPTSAYYAAIAKEYAELGLKVVAVVSNDQRVDEVHSWLAKHPMEGVSVLRDTRHVLYPAYHVVPEGWGLPRILLLDVDGTVAWEGDPNLSKGAGWDPQDPTMTPVDVAIDDLAARRKLFEIADLLPQLERAQAALAAGRYREAILGAKPLVDLGAGAEHSPAVAEARDVIARAEAAGVELAKQAAAADDEGRVLAARTLWLRIGSEFPGGELAILAVERAAQLERDPRHREAVRGWKMLEKAVAEAAKAAPAAEILTRLDEAAAACPNAVEVQTAAAALRATLLSADGGPAALPALWEKQ
jgi:tetratricopeptide (TPR) repeat protein